MVGTVNAAQLRKTIVQTHRPVCFTVIVLKRGTKSVISLLLLDLLEMMRRKPQECVKGAENVHFRIGHFNLDDPETQCQLSCGHLHSIECKCGGLQGLVREGH